MRRDMLVKTRAFKMWSLLSFLILIDLQFMVCLREKNKILIKFEDDQEESLVKAKLNREREKLELEPLLVKEFPKKNEYKVRYQGLLPSLYVQDY
jgi:hypothetical protein